MSVHRLASDMAMLFWGFDFVTSLVDFYGFVGKGDSSPDQLEVRIREAVFEKLTGTWDQRRVIPYVQKHEFEGLLFSNVEAFESSFDLPEESIRALRRVREAFPTPEDINDNIATAPSGPPYWSLSAGQRRRDREARLAIGRELGHERGEITGIYCGV